MRYVYVERTEEEKWACVTDTGGRNVVYTGTLDACLRVKDALIDTGHYEDLEDDKKDMQAERNNSMKKQVYVERTVGVNGEWNCFVDDSLNCNNIYSGTLDACLRVKDALIATGEFTDIKRNTRKLKDGRQVPETVNLTEMTISSKCPEKWLFVDLETGDIWKHAHNGKDDFTRARKEDVATLKKLVENAVPRMTLPSMDHLHGYYRETIDKFLKEQGRDPQEFWQWMTGQTVTSNGNKTVVYAEDFVRFLKGLPVID